MEDQTALPGIAARAALIEEILSSGAATHQQIEFIGMVVEHLTDKGAMALLHEPPFTDIGPAGPEQVFDEGRWCSWSERSGRSTTARWPKSRRPKRIDQGSTGEGGQWQSP